MESAIWSYGFHCANCYQMLSELRRFDFEFHFIPFVAIQFERDSVCPVEHRSEPLLIRTVENNKTGDDCSETPYCNGQLISDVFKSDIIELLMQMEARTNQENGEMATHYWNSVISSPYTIISNHANGSGYMPSAFPQSHESSADDLNELSKTTLILMVGSF